MFVSYKENTFYVFASVEHMVSAMSHPHYNTKMLQNSSFAFEVKESRCTVIKDRSGFFVPNSTGGTFYIEPEKMLKIIEILMEI
jgi:hypothetical protein